MKLNIKLYIFMSLFLVLSLSAIESAYIAVPASNEVISKTDETQIVGLSSDYLRYDDMLVQLGGVQEFYDRSLSTNIVWDKFTSFYNAQNTTINFDNITAVNQSRDSYVLNTMKFRGDQTVQNMSLLSKYYHNSKIGPLSRKISAYYDYFDTNTSALYTGDFSVHDNSLYLTDCSHVFSPLFYAGGIIEFEFVFMYTQNFVTLKMTLFDEYNESVLMFNYYYNDPIYGYANITISNGSSTAIFKVSAQKNQFYRVYYLINLINETYYFDFDNGSLITNNTKCTSHCDYVERFLFNSVGYSNSFVIDNISIYKLYPDSIFDWYLAADLNATKKYVIEEGLTSNWAINNESLDILEAYHEGQFYTVKGNITSPNPEVTLIANSANNPWFSEFYCEDNSNITLRLYSPVNVSVTVIIDYSNLLVDTFEFNLSNWGSFRFILLNASNSTVTGISIRYKLNTTQINKIITILIDSIYITAGLQRAGNSIVLPKYVYTGLAYKSINSSETIAFYGEVNLTDSLPILDIGVCSFNLSALNPDVLHTFEAYIYQDGYVYINFSVDGKKPIKVRYGLKLPLYIKFNNIDIVEFIERVKVADYYYLSNLDTTVVKIYPNTAQIKNIGSDFMVSGSWSTLYYNNFGYKVHEDVWSYYNFNTTDLSEIYLNFTVPDILDVINISFRASYGFVHNGNPGVTVSFLSDKWDNISYYNTIPTAWGYSDIITLNVNTTEIDKYVHNREFYVKVTIGKDSLTGYSGFMLDYAYIQIATAPKHYSLFVSEQYSLSYHPIDKFDHPDFNREVFSDHYNVNYTNNITVLGDYYQYIGYNGTQENGEIYYFSYVFKSLPNVFIFSPNITQSRVKSISGISTFYRSNIENITFYLQFLFNFTIRQRMTIEVFNNSNLKWELITPYEKFISMVPSFKFYGTNGPIKWRVWSRKIESFYNLSTVSVISNNVSISYMKFDWDDWRKTVTRDTIYDSFENNTLADYTVENNITGVEELTWDPVRKAIYFWSDSGVAPRLSLSRGFSAAVSYVELTIYGELISPNGGTFNVWLKGGDNSVRLYIDPSGDLYYSDGLNSMADTGVSINRGEEFRLDILFDVDRSSGLMCFDGSLIEGKELKFWSEDTSKYIDTMSITTAGSISTPSEFYIDELSAGVILSFSPLGEQDSVEASDGGCNGEVLYNNYTYTFEANDSINFDGDSMMYSRVRDFPGSATELWLKFSFGYPLDYEQGLLMLGLKWGIYENVSQVASAQFIVSVYDYVNNKYINLTAFKPILQPYEKRGYEVNYFFSYANKKNFISNIGDSLVRIKAYFTHNDFHNGYNSPDLLFGVDAVSLTAEKGAVEVVHIIKYNTFKYNNATEIDPIVYRAYTNFSIIGGASSLKYVDGDFFSVFAINEKDYSLDYPGIRCYFTVPVKTSTDGVILKLYKFRQVNYTYGQTEPAITKVSAYNYIKKTWETIGWWDGMVATSYTDLTFYLTEDYVVGSKLVFYVQTIGYAWPTPPRHPRAFIELDAIEVITRGVVLYPNIFKLHTAASDTCIVEHTISNLEVGFFKAETDFFIDYIGNVTLTDYLGSGNIQVYYIINVSSDGQFMGSYNLSLYNKTRIRLPYYVRKFKFNLTFVVNVSKAIYDVLFNITKVEFLVYAQPDEIMLKVNNISPEPTGLHSAILKGIFESRQLNITSRYPARVDLTVTGHFYNSSTPLLQGIRTLMFYWKPPLNLSLPTVKLYNCFSKFVYIRTESTDWTEVSITGGNESAEISTSELNAVLDPNDVVINGTRLDLKIITKSDVYCLAKEPRDQVEMPAYNNTLIDYVTTLYLIYDFQYAYFVEPNYVGSITLTRRSTGEIIPHVYHYGKYYYFSSSGLESPFNKDDIFDISYKIDPGWDISTSLVKSNSTYLEADLEISSYYWLQDVIVTLPNFGEYQYWTIELQNDFYKLLYSERFNGHFTQGVIDGQYGWSGLGTITKNLYYNFPYSVCLGSAISPLFTNVSEGKIITYIYLSNMNSSLLNITYLPNIQIGLDRYTKYLFIRYNATYIVTNISVQFGKWHELILYIENSQIWFSLDDLVSPKFNFSTIINRLIFNGEGSYIDYITIYHKFKAGADLSELYDIRQIDGIVYINIPSVTQTVQEYKIRAYKVFIDYYELSGTTTTFIKYEVNMYSTRPDLFVNTTVQISAPVSQYLIWKVFRGAVQQPWEIDTSYSDFLLITVPTLDVKQVVFYIHGYSWKYTQDYIEETETYAHYRIIVETNDVDAVNEVGGGVIRADILNVLDFEVWTVTGDYCTFYFNQSEDAYADHINVNLTHVDTSPIYLEIQGYKPGTTSEKISQDELKIFYTCTLSLPRNDSLAPNTTLYVIVPEAVDYYYWTLTAGTKNGSLIDFTDNSSWQFSVYVDRVEWVVPSIEACLAADLVRSFPDFVIFNVKGYSYKVHSPQLTYTSDVEKRYDVKIETANTNSIENGTIVSVEISRDSSWSVLELWLNNENVTTPYDFTVDSFTQVHWRLYNVSSLTTTFQIRVYTWSIDQILLQDADLLVRYSIEISAGHDKVVNYTEMTIDITEIDPAIYRAWEIYYGSYEDGENLTGYFSLLSGVNIISITVPNFSRGSLTYNLYGFGVSVEVTRTQSIDLEEVYEVEIQTLHNKSVVNESITVPIVNIYEYEYWELTYQNVSLDFTLTADSIEFTISMPASTRTYIVHGYSWRAYSYVYNDVTKEKVVKTEVTVLRDLNLTGKDREVAINVEDYYSKIFWEIKLGDKTINISRFDSSTIYFDLPALLNDTVSGLQADYVFIITGYAYEVSQLLTTDNFKLEQYRVTVEYSHEFHNLSHPWDRVTCTVKDRATTEKWYWEVYSDNTSYTIVESTVTSVTWEVTDFSGSLTVFTVSGYGYEVVPLDDENAFVEETGSMILYRVQVNTLKVEALNTTSLGVSPIYIDITFSSTNIDVFSTWKFYHNSRGVAVIYNYSTQYQNYTEIIPNYNFSMTNIKYQFYITEVNETNNIFDLVGYRTEVHLELTPLDQLQYKFTIEISGEDLSVIETELYVTKDTRDDVDTKIADVQYVVFWELQWNNTIVSDEFNLRAYSDHVIFKPKDLGLTPIYGRYSTIFYLYAYKLDYDYVFDYLNQTFMRYRVVVRTPSNNTVNSPFKYQPEKSLPQIFADPTLTSGNTVYLTSSGLKIEINDLEHSFSQMKVWEFYQVSPFVQNTSQYMSYGDEIITVYIPYLNSSGDSEFELRGYDYYVSQSLINMTDIKGHVEIKIASLLDFKRYQVSFDLIFGSYNFTGKYVLYCLYNQSYSLIDNNVEVSLNRFIYSFNDTGVYYLIGYNYLVQTSIIDRNSTFLRVKVNVISDYQFREYSLYRPLVFNDVDVSEDYSLYSWYFGNGTMYEYNVSVNIPEKRYNITVYQSGTYYVHGYNWARDKVFMDINNETYNEVSINVNSLAEFGSYSWVQDCTISNATVANYKKFELWRDFMYVIRANKSLNVSLLSGIDALLVFNLSSQSEYKIFLDNTTLVQRGKYYGQKIYVYSDKFESHFYSIFGDNDFVLYVNISRLDFTTYVANMTANSTFRAYVNYKFTLKWALASSGYYRVFRNGSQIIASTPFSNGDFAVWESTYEHLSAKVYKYTLEIDTGSGFKPSSIIYVSVISVATEMLVYNSSEFIKRPDNTFLVTVSFKGRYILKSYSWIVEREMVAQRNNYFDLSFTIKANTEFDVYEFFQPYISEGSMGYNISGYISYYLEYENGSKIEELIQYSNYLVVVVHSRHFTYSIRGYSWSYSYQVVEHELGMYMEVDLFVVSYVKVGDVQFDLDLSDYLVFLDYWAVFSGNGSYLSTDIRRIGYHVRFTLFVNETANFTIKGYGTLITITDGSVYYSNWTHFGAKMVVNVLENSSDPILVALDLSKWLERPLEFWGVVINGKKTDIAIEHLGDYVYSFTLPNISFTSKYEIFGFSDSLELISETTSLVRLKYTLNTFSGVDNSLRVVLLPDLANEYQIWDIYFENGSFYKNVENYSSNYVVFFATIEDDNTTFPRQGYIIQGKRVEVQLSLIVDTGVYTEVKATIITSFVINNRTFIVDLRDAGVDHSHFMESWSVYYENRTFYSNAEEIQVCVLKFSLSQSSPYEKWVLIGRAPVPFATITKIVPDKNVIISPGEKVFLRAYLDFDFTSRYWYVNVSSNWSVYAIYLGDGTRYDIEYVMNGTIFFEGWANPLSTAYVYFEATPIIRIEEKFVSSNIYSVKIVVAFDLRGVALLTSDLKVKSRKVFSGLSEDEVRAMAILKGHYYKLDNLSLVKGENEVYLYFRDIEFKPVTIGGLILSIIVIVVAAVYFVYKKFFSKKKEVPEVLKEKFIKKTKGKRSK